MAGVLVREQGRVVRVTLNRPEVRNAISLGLRTELAETFAALAARPDLHVLVLAGEGPAFCAGGDLREMAQVGGDEEAADRITIGNRMIQELYAVPYPTIAAVHGAVAGAGCSLALACDLVVAAESTTFRMAFVHIGLGPDAGASVLVPARVGPARAKEMFLLGTPLPAQAAYEAGLVNRVVPDASLEAEVAGLAEAVAAVPRPAAAAVKRLVGTPEVLAETMRRELREQVALLASDEHRRAREAFLSRKGRRMS